VAHGKMTVNIPRDMFKGDAGTIDDEKAASFRETLRCRYPWLTENSLDVLMENARKVAVGLRDEETDGRSLSRVLESQGRVGEAIRHLEGHLERDPSDADTWYALGELLCKSGRAEEGYKAFAQGRALF